MENVAGAVVALPRTDDSADETNVVFTGSDESGISWGKMKDDYQVTVTPTKFPDLIINAQSIVLSMSTWIIVAVLFFFYTGEFWLKFPVFSPYMAKAKIGEI